MDHRIILLTALFAAAACGESSGDTKPTDTGSTSSSGAGGSTSVASTTTTGAGGDSTGASGGEGGALLAGPGVMGLLHDEDGAPIGETVVLACTLATCYFGESLSDGRFAFELTDPVTLAIKTEEDLSVTPRRGAALVAVPFDGSGPLDIGGVFVPNLPDGAAVGPVSADPQTLDIGDGLELTVRRADIDPPLGFALVDIAARAIPEEHLHTIPGLGSDEIIGVYALHPFSAKSSSAIAVRAPSTLPAGTKVNFRTMSYFDGHLSDPAVGTADGSFVATDASQGIYEITWLVISK